jgi:DNA-binding NarL/FixJ family response regulator
MRLYARMGQRSRALRQFQVMSSALRQELDSEPDRRSTELHRAILTGQLPAADGPPALMHLSGQVLRQALTRREHEVALLVARGLTNRQIALRLGLSGRTADTHVCRILHKLGLRFRAEVAVWAQQPADGPMQSSGWGG